MEVVDRFSCYCEAVCSAAEYAVQVTEAIQQTIAVVTGSMSYGAMKPHYGDTAVARSGPLRLIGVCRCRVTPRDAYRHAAEALALSTFRAAASTAWAHGVMSRNVAQYPKLKDQYAVAKIIRTRSCRKPLRR